MPAVTGPSGQRHSGLCLAHSVYSLDALVSSWTVPGMAAHSALVRRIRGRAQRAATRFLLVVWSPVFRYIDKTVVPPLREHFDKGVSDVLDAVDVLAETATVAESSELRSLRNCVLAALEECGAVPSFVDHELASLGLSEVAGSQNSVPVTTRTAGVKGPRIEVGFPGRGDTVPRGDHWAVVSSGAGVYRTVRRTGGTAAGCVTTVRIVEV